MSHVLATPLYRIPAGAEYARPVWAKFRATTSGAAATLTANWRNSDSRPFAPDALGGYLAPGAAQYATKWWCVMFPPEGTGAIYLDGGELSSTVAAEANHVGPRVDTVIPPLWYLSLGVRFNAGAASNAITFDLVGWLFSRGTLSLP